MLGLVVSFPRYWTEKLFRAGIFPMMYSRPSFSGCTSLLVECKDAACSWNAVLRLSRLLMVRAERYSARRKLVSQSQFLKRHDSEHTAPEGLCPRSDLSDPPPRRAPPSARSRNVTARSHLRRSLWIDTIVSNLCKSSGQRLKYLKVSCSKKYCQSLLTAAYRARV